MILVDIWFYRVFALILLVEYYAQTMHLTSQQADKLRQFIVLKRQNDKWYIHKDKRPLKWPFYQSHQ